MDFNIEFIPNRETRPIDVDISMSVMNGMELDMGVVGAVGCGDKTYIHIQSLASDVWHVIHNLKKYPSVSIVDSGGSLVVGEVTYLSENTLDISFSASFSGSAYLN